MPTFQDDGYHRHDSSRQLQLQELKEAVDHAASGNYLIDFELRGQGEVVELAKSVRRLVAHMQ
jgi:HAMP domain-containing protein